ncbi:TRAP transporter large permease [Oceanomicrobium pacificus]|uniref:TRAP transporter large permease subunit n=1 Tax=Oceanomicrobium pacificus TaxID=2692916 RepID=A0A6B0U6Z1_9RHOB|nr:TRAP transporter large permease subunit [Oceanomicrobium pacificus]MXU66621.1 TRAP transporter large permease subunit [Oceanomicrobium pacificus]
MDFIELLPLFMFIVLGVSMFSGFPVAFVLGGVGLLFGLIGIMAGEFMFIQFRTLPSRIFGGIMENLILTAIPMFIFMGTMLERSGIARDLLNCLQVLMRRVPGGLALSVTIMGTILAATTGIIGASVIMMSLLALPVMIERNYNHELATGTIAASGTLGILIPPSIMLVIMADLLSRSVGNLFVAAVFPGLILAGLYVVYIVVRCTINPKLAPALDQDLGPQTGLGVFAMVVRSFVPPVILIGLVLGSILGGFATPTEAAGVGAMGAILLGLINLVILPSLGVEEFVLETTADTGIDDHPVGGGFWRELRHYIGVLADVVERTMLTNAMIFGIFIGATLFSYIFRALGGDDLVIDLVESLGLGSWGLLFLIMALVFVLGFFFDWIEITLIVLPVFAPIIAQLDFGDHVAKFEVTYWFAILLAVNLQTSFLTPPFGFALFYLKAVAPENVRIQEIYRGIIPFVLLQLIGLALVMSFPDIALWLPRVLLN